MDYYDNQLNKHTADLKPFFGTVAILVVVLAIGLLGQCCFKDEKATAEGEAKFSEFDEYRAAEVMSRQAETQVEKDYKLWREKTNGTRESNSIK